MTEMRDLNVGDLFMVTTSGGNGRVQELIGRTGKVLRIENPSFRGAIAILAEFEDWHGGHSGDSVSDVDNRWWLYEKETLVERINEKMPSLEPLELVKEAEEPVQQIIDDVEVTALANIVDILLSADLEEASRDRIMNYLYDRFM